MPTPKLITFTSCVLILNIFCVPLATDMWHQPAYGWHLWHQPDRHIEPRELFFPLVPSETLTATGSFTGSSSFQVGSLRSSLPRMR